jgi:hypothetical protein
MNIRVDTWNDKDENTGEIILNFAPKIATGAPYTLMTYDPDGRTEYEPYLRFPIPSSPAEDKLLLDEFRKLQKRGSESWNPLYNCWVFSLLMVGSGIGGVPTKAPEPIGNGNGLCSDAMNLVLGGGVIF